MPSGTARALMDSRFLQSFVAVVELGSIAAAARHLQMSSAAVAQRVQALEATLGSKLIVRSGRTVKATAAGNRVLRRAPVVLREIRDLQSAASESELPSGPLRLGAYVSALTGIAPAILRAWVDRYPHIEIQIELEPSTSRYGKIMSGELDIGFLVQPLFDLPKVCRWQPLTDAPLVLLTPSRMHVDNPLAVLCREPFIRYDRTVVLGKLVTDYLHRHGVHPRTRFEINGIEPIARLVAEGLGVAIAPDHPMQENVLMGVKAWPLPGPCPKSSVGLLWLHSSTRCQLAEAFAAVASRVMLERKLPRRPQRARAAIEPGKSRISSE
jgi:DNA-binding transcriptional LysR family regulator